MTSDEDRPKMLALRQIAAAAGKLARRIESCGPLPQGEYTHALVQIQKQFLTLLPLDQEEPLFYNKEDLGMLLVEIEKLHALVENLQDDGFPVTDEYLREKIDRLWSSAPLQLHPLLQRYMERKLALARQAKNEQD